LQDETPTPDDADMLEAICRWLVRIGWAGLILFWVGSALIWMFRATIVPRKKTADQSPDKEK
jgi:hypothetical protein